MMVQLSTVLSFIWLCGLVGSQFVPGYGQGAGYGLGYGQGVGYGLGQGQRQGYNPGQGIGHRQGYEYLQGQGDAHQNLPGYRYNQLQAQEYGYLQGQPYAHALLQKKTYGNHPVQRNRYLQFQGYRKQTNDRGFNWQISELPSKQGHTQQQQREAWQNQIDQVVKVEEKLKQRSLLGSGNTRNEEGSKRADPVVGKIVETFEIIDLHGLKNEKVESIEKSDGLKVNLDVMNSKETENVQEEIQEVKVMLLSDSLYQKSSYIEEAEIFLSKFNDKQKLKDIEPAYPESLKENNVADKTTEKDNKSVINTQSTKSDVHGKVPAEKLEQSQIKDILIENVKTKEGLKEIIKKLLKTKLESEGLSGI